jgi:hypothetical protein
VLFEHAAGPDGVAHGGVVPWGVDLAPTDRTLCGVQEDMLIWYHATEDGWPDFSRPMSQVEMIPNRAVDVDR